LNNIVKQGKNMMMKLKN